MRYSSEPSAFSGPVLSTVYLCSPKLPNCTVTVLHRLGQRVLGDQVDGARGLARAVDHRGRTLQDLDPMDVGEIAGRVGRIEEAVFAIVAGGDRKAAEEKGVRARSFVHLDRAADIGEQVVDADHLLVLSTAWGTTLTVAGTSICGTLISVPAVEESAA